MVGPIIQEPTITTVTDRLHGGGPPVIPLRSLQQLLRLMRRRRVYLPVAAGPSGPFVWVRVKHGEAIRWYETVRKSGPWWSSVVAVPEGNQVKLGPFGILGGR